MEILKRSGHFSYLPQLNGIEMSGHELARIKNSS